MDCRKRKANWLRDAGREFRGSDHSNLPPEDADDYRQAELGFGKLLAQEGGQVAGESRVSVAVAVSCATAMACASQSMPTIREALPNDCFAKNPVPQ